MFESFSALLEIPLWYLEAAALLLWLVFALRGALFAATIYGAVLLAYLFLQLRLTELQQFWAQLPAASGMP